MDGSQRSKTRKSFIENDFVEDMLYYVDVTPHILALEDKCLGMEM